MSAKRTPASVNLEVLETRLDSQDKAMSELKASHELAVANLRADTKEVLAAITATNLEVAKLPKWDDLKRAQEAVDARLLSLETTRSEQKGGWKAITIIGGICATLGGWLGSLISNWLQTPTPKTGL